MIFKDRIIDIINVLENKGVVCLPDDHRWNLAVLPSYYENSGVLTEYALVTENIPTILFENLNHLKSGLPSLHPRIETMLVYYKRTFLMTTNADKVKHIPVISDIYHLSIARNEYLKTILSLLGNALILWPLKNAYGPDYQIPEEILKIADYVCQERDYLDLTESYVTFSVDDEGVLIG
jgi:hypothetical protein